MSEEEVKSNDEYIIWGFAGTVAWSVVIAISFMLVQIVTLMIYVGIQQPDITSQADIETYIKQVEFNGLFLSVATLATFFSCSLLMMGIIKLKKGSNLQHYFGLYSIEFKTVRFWFLVFVCLMVVTELITYLLGKPLVPDVIKTVYTSTDSTWLLFIAIVIAAPIFEELFFRGFIITGLSSTFFGPVGAVVLSSIAWAAIHTQYDFYFVSIIFIYGLFLGFVRLKTNSVLLTIGLHAFLNLASMIQTSMIV